MCLFENTTSESILGVLGSVDVFQFRRLCGDCSRVYDFCFWSISAYRVTFSIKLTFSCISWVIALFSVERRASGGKRGTQRQKSFDYEKPIVCHRKCYAKFPRSDRMAGDFRVSVTNNREKLREMISEILIPMRGFFHLAKDHNSEDYISTIQTHKQIFRNLELSRTGQTENS